MSSYVHGSRMSYRDYLQTKEFVEDIRWDMSQANLNVVATNETLQRFGVQVSTGIEKTHRTLEETNRTIDQGFGRVQEGMERGFSEVAGRLEDVDRTLVGGFVTLHSDLMSVDSSIGDLSAKFEWGFSEVLLSLGSANELLAALVKLARTPEQTWAFEQYEIARDAFRRGLYREALDYVERAIGGHQGHTGYNIEHRFHSLVGVIRLGSYKNSSPDVVSEEKAYESFQRAARYAMSDYREDAARALRGAAQAAYCLGRFDLAETHATEALRLNPKLGEAAFQLAKTLMHLDEVKRALPALAHAVKLDALYSLRAFDDEDFRMHERAVRELVGQLRDELADFCQKQIADTLGILRGGHQWLDAMVRERITTENVPGDAREIGWLRLEEDRVRTLAETAQRQVAAKRLLETVTAASTCVELVQIAKVIAERTGARIASVCTHLDAAPERLIGAFLKRNGYLQPRGMSAQGRTVLTLLSITVVILFVAEFLLYQKIQFELAHNKIPPGVENAVSAALLNVALFGGGALYGLLYLLLSGRLRDGFEREIAAAQARRDEQLRASAPTACKSAIDTIVEYGHRLEREYMSFRAKVDALAAVSARGWSIPSEPLVLRQ